MPALPELRNTGGQEGRREIPRESNSEQISRADRNIGIARKIEIDLEGEQYGAEPCPICAIWLSEKNFIDDRSEAVRQHHFLCQPQGDETKPEGEQPVASPMAAEQPAELRQRLLGTDDGSGDELRKESLEQEKFAERLCWFAATLRDIDMVGQGLETVEGDAEGQRGIEIAAGLAHFAKQEISIFEISDQPDIDDDRRGDALPAGRDGDLNQPIQRHRGTRANPDPGAAERQQQGIRERVERHSTAAPHDTPCERYHGRSTDAAFAGSGDEAKHVISFRTSSAATCVGRDYAEFFRWSSWGLRREE